MKDCTYCGAPADTLDHVIPLTYNRTVRGPYTRGSGGLRVPCCRECNSLLGAKALFSVPERAHEIAECLERRYRKELNAPVWSEEEIADLGDSLRRQVEAKQFLRLEVVERIRNAVSVAQGLLEQALPLWGMSDIPQEVSGAL